MDFVWRKHFFHFSRFTFHFFFVPLHAQLIK